MIDQTCAEKKPLSVGVLGNAAEVFPELVRRGVRPDVVTDQTSAHDPINGYLPAGWTLDEWQARRECDPEASRRLRSGHGGARAAMLAFTCRGVPTLDYGNNIRQMAKDVGVATRSTFRVRAGLHPPAVLPRHRTVPLGGAVGRSRRHLQDRRQGEGAMPTTGTCTTGSTWLGRGSSFRACPHASAGWAWATGIG